MNECFEYIKVSFVVLFDVGCGLGDDLLVLCVCFLEVLVFGVDLFGVMFVWVG